MANILVVDDDEVIQKTIRAALVKAGHTVVIAQDGHAALDKSSRELFDLIVSDANMPSGLSGFNFVATLRQIERYKKAPIMFLTGRREKKDVLRALESGADDYLTKPIDFDMFLAKIESLLKSKQELHSFAEATVLFDSIWAVALKINGISEQGLKLTTSIQMCVNYKFKVESEIFNIIGIEAPELRLASCAPTSKTETSFAVRANFIGLTEPELQKIRKWTTAHGPRKVKVAS